MQFASNFMLSFYYAITFRIGSSFMPLFALHLSEMPLNFKGNRQISMFIEDGFFHIKCYEYLRCSTCGIAIKFIFKFSKFDLLSNMQRVTFMYDDFMVVRWRTFTTVYFFRSQYVTDANVIWMRQVDAKYICRNKRMPRNTA